MGREWVEYLFSGNFFRRLTLPSRNEDCGTNSLFGYVVTMCYNACWRAREWLPAFQSSCLYFAYFFTGVFLFSEDAERFVGNARNVSNRVRKYRKRRDATRRLSRIPGVEFTVAFGGVNHSISRIPRKKRTVCISRRVSHTDVKSRISKPTPFSLDQ